MSSSNPDTLKGVVVAKTPEKVKKMRLKYISMIIERQALRKMFRLYT